MKNSNDLFGITGASIFLGIAVATIRRNVAAGKLPCVRDSSNKRLFKRKALEAFKRDYKYVDQQRARQ